MRELDRLREKVDEVGKYSIVFSLFDIAKNHFHLVVFF